MFFVRSRGTEGRLMVKFGLKKGTMVKVGVEDKNGDNCS